MGNKEVEKIKANIIKELQINIKAKVTNTPFGKVYSDLKTVVLPIPRKKGDVLAQVIRKKNGLGQKKEEFVWLGVVEKNDSVVTFATFGKGKVYYRPFEDQHDKFQERYDQLFKIQEGSKK